MNESDESSNGSNYSELSYKSHHNRKSFSLMEFSIDVRYFILMSWARANSRFPDWWSDAKASESCDISSRIIERMSRSSSLVPASSTCNVGCYYIHALLCELKLPLHSSPSSPGEILSRLSCCLQAVSHRPVQVNTPLVPTGFEESYKLCLSKNSTQRSAFVPRRSSLKTCPGEFDFEIPWISSWVHLHRFAVAFEGQKD